MAQGAKCGLDDGLDYDLNLDKLIRHSGVGARNTNMAGAAGGAASSSGL